MTRGTSLRAPAAWPGPSQRASTLPVKRESAVPWLAASVAIALLGAAVTIWGHGNSDIFWLLAIGLSGSIAAAGLVVARSSQMVEVAEAEERARPAADELAPSLGAPRVTYVEGMARWTTAIISLTEHGARVTPEGSEARTELAAAAQETRDLRDLLEARRHDDLSLNDLARLHALTGLWETGEARLEQLVAAADPEWYRLWRARVVADRLLRHGLGRVDRAVLPYRS